MTSASNECMRNINKQPIKQQLDDVTRLFVGRLKDYPVHFTIGGIMTIGKISMLSVTGVLASYVVVLIQFQDFYVCSSGNSTG